MCHIDEDKAIMVTIGSPIVALTIIFLVFLKKLKKKVYSSVAVQFRTEPAGFSKNGQFHTKPVISGLNNRFGLVWGRNRSDHQFYQFRSGSGNTGFNLSLIPPH